MKPVAFASVGECMIELSAGKGADWRLGYAGDTFNTAWYVRAILPKGQPRRLRDGARRRSVLRQDAELLRRSRRRDRPHPKDRRAAAGPLCDHAEKAERAFTYWRSESAARRLADDAAWLKRALGGAGMLYFSGITLAILSTAGAAAAAGGDRGAAEGRRNDRLRSELPPGALARQEDGAGGDRSGVSRDGHRAPDAFRRARCFRRSHRRPHRPPADRFRRRRIRPEERRQAGARLRRRNPRKSAADETAAPRRHDRRRRFLLRRLSRRTDHWARPALQRRGSATSSRPRSSACTARSRRSTARSAQAADGREVDGAQ